MAAVMTVGLFSKVTSLGWWAMRGWVSAAQGYAYILDSGTAGDNSGVAADRSGTTQGHWTPEEGKERCVHGYLMVARFLRSAHRARM